MTNPCSKADCPLVERRRKNDRLRPIVDIAKIMVLIGMAHLVLRLVSSLGTVVYEIQQQTKLVQNIHDLIASQRGK